jgi:hypothetical protein
MSYSDYGSYNWSKENGKWVYKPEFEDCSLERGQMDKSLEKITGIKFDIVADHKKENEKLPWYVTGTSHSVIGQLNGYAVVSYKGFPHVIYNGVEIDTIEFDEFFTDEIWNSELDMYEKKENFIPKIIEIIEADNIVKVAIDNSINYWSVAYVKNNNIEHLSLCGYGLGEHWWLDDKGNETYEGSSNQIWPREKESLIIAQNILKV